MKTRREIEFYKRAFEDGGFRHEALVAMGKRRTTNQIITWGFIFIAAGAAIHGWIRSHNLDEGLLLLLLGSLFLADVWVAETKIAALELFDAKSRSKCYDVRA